MDTLKDTHLLSSDTKTWAEQRAEFHARRVKIHKDNNILSTDNKMKSDQYADFDLRHAIDYEGKHEYIGYPTPANTPTNKIGLNE
jgi:hypothetical protein